MITLYPDQEDLVQRVRAAMRHHRWVLLQSSTGSGKTRMALDMITGAVSKGSRSIFCVPRRELLAQTVETLKEYDVPFGVISPEHVPDPFAPIQIAMIPTLARRLDKTQAPRVLFMDECHFGGTDLDRVIAWGKAAGCYGVGMSATPLKNNGKPMGDWYDTMEQGLPVADLIAQGRLSRYRYFAPSAPDLSGLQVRDGNYVQSQVSAFMEEQDAIIGDAVRTYRDTAMGKLCVVFATSRKHAGLIVDAFVSAGITAKAIDGTMDTQTRKRLVMGFARREYTVLVNVLLLTFGFDLAQAASMDVRVEALSDMCPRKSLPMQMQVWGRALRAGDEPSVILDHANNWREHGFPDSPREWTLEGSKKREAGDRNEPVRQCPECYFVHRPAPACPSCGYFYPVQSRIVQEVEGELREMDPTEMAQARKAKRAEQGQADSLEALLAIAKREGRNPRWAHHVWTARQRKKAGA